MTLGQLLDLGVPLGDFGLEVSDPVLLFLPLFSELLLSGGSLIFLLHVRVEGSSGLVPGLEASLQGDKFGGDGLAREPFFSSCGGVGGSSGREDVILEDIISTLTGHLEGDGFHSCGGQLQQPSNLALASLATKLGKSAHTTRWNAGCVLTQVVELGTIISQFVVTNVTVTLARKEQHASVVIVEGHQLTRCCVNVFVGKRGAEVSGIPDGILTIRGLGETNAQDLASVTKEDGTRTLDTVVGSNFPDDGVRTRIKNTNLLVLAGSHNLATIVVPGYSLDDVTVTINSVSGLALLDIPQFDGVVSGRGSQNVGSGGVPVYGTDLPLVTSEVLNGISHGVGETTFGDVPKLGSAVLRGGGDDGLVEGVEVNIQDGSLVTSNQGIVGLEFTLSLEGNNHERTSSSSLNTDSEVFKVGADVVGIPSVSAQLNVIVALLLLEGLAENVSVLGLTDYARHAVLFFFLF